MKKRILSAILSVIMCVTLLPNMAYAVDPVPAGNVTGISYKVVNGTVGVPYVNITPVLTKGTEPATGDPNAVYELTRAPESIFGELTIDGKGVLSLGTPKVAGIYKFTVKYYSATDGDIATFKDATITIEKGKYAPPSKPGVEFKDETLTGLITGATYELYNATDAKVATFKVETGTIQKIDLSWMTGANFKLLRVGDANFNNSEKSEAFVIPNAPTATPTITISAGKFMGTTTLMEYSNDSKTWTICTADMLIPPADVGKTVLFRFKTTSTAFASKTTEVLATGQYPAPTLVVDYEKETLTGLTSGATYKLYNAANTEIAEFTLSATTQKIDPLWMTNGDFTLVRKGNGTTFTDSAKSSAVKIPNRPVAPTITAGTGANVGKLMGTLAEHEYFYYLTTDPWINCTADIFVGAGTYYVRVKAKAGSNFAGTPTAAIELKGKYATPNVTVSESSGVIIDLAPGTYKVRYTPKAGGTVVPIPVTVTGTEMVVLDDWMGSTGFQLMQESTTIGYSDSEWSTGITLNVRANAVAAAEKAKFTPTANKITTTVIDPKLYEYKLSTDTTWTGMKATQTVESGGTYQIRLKGVDDKNFASLPFELVVAGEKQPKPTLVIDYVNKTLTGLVAGATYELHNAADTVVKTFALTAPATTYEIESSWMTGTSYTLVHKGKDGVADSVKSDAVVIPTNPAAPTITISGDGKSFTGTTALMQYSIDSGSTWKDCTAGMAIPTADVGKTFLFRVKAITTAFAGNTQSLATTGKYSKPTTPGINYVNETLTGLLSGATYELYNATPAKVATFTVSATATTQKIDPLWMTGAKFTLVHKGDGNFTDSDKSAEFIIPIRPSASTPVKSPGGGPAAVVSTLLPYGVNLICDPVIKDSSKKSALTDRFVKDYSKNGYNLFSYADISLVYTDGTPYKSTSPITLTVYVAGVTSSDFVTVLHYKDDNTVEVISATAGNGSVTFTTTGFSPFAFVVKKAPQAAAGSTTTTADTTPTSPKTGVYS